MSIRPPIGIDIRAKVVCYVFPRKEPYQIISGSVNDDSAVDTGIVKTRGTIEIQGLVTPPIGTDVWVEYTYSYWRAGLIEKITQALPRELRVISSFADPIRRTTKLEVGCTFTLRSEFTDPNVPTLSGSFFADISGFGGETQISIEEVEALLTEEDIVTIPLKALKLVNYLRVKIGVGGDDIFLANNFSIKEFDLSGAYVAIMSDLIKSEVGIIRMDSRKVLSQTPLGGPKWKTVWSPGRILGGTRAPAVNSGSIIDIGPVNGGQIPPGKVIAKYNTLVLAAPDDVELRCGPEFPADEPQDPNNQGRVVESASTVNTSKVVIAYSTPSLGPQPPAGTPITKTQVFATLESSYDETLFQTFQFKDPEASTSPRTNLTDGEFFTAVESGINFQTISKTVPIQRVTYESRSAASIAGGVVQNYLSAGLGFGNFMAEFKVVEAFLYDQYGNETFRSLRKTGSALFAFGSAGLQMVFEDEQGNVSAVDLPNNPIDLEAVTVSTTRNGPFTTTVTKRYGPWLTSIPGQQSIAEARESLDTAAKVANYLQGALGGSQLLDVTTSTTFSPAGSQEAPSPLDDLAEEFADEDTADLTNGFRTESKAGTETAGEGELLVVSIPYSDDDSFDFRLESRTDDEGNVFYTRCYYSGKSNAAQVAARYARFQFDLVRGSRLGLSLQLPIYAMPTEPLQPIAVNLTPSGPYVVYAADAISWTFDSNGIVGSVDGILIGTAGRGLT
jgi:hypothetical protein